MKIIFFCGSLEPGKDGVGDYTMLLAAEVVKQGHTVKVIALNDKHINSETAGTDSAANGFTASYRLPSSASWKNRMLRVKEIIAEFTPNWVSLQFVPYAYNDKGLPFNLPYLLRPVFKGLKVHVMHHELWVENRDKKGLLLAFLQKKIIGLLHKTLKPNLSHTHVPAYAERLLQLGVKAKALPVFSNIPFIPAKANHPEGVFNVGFFSQVTYRAEIISFLKQLSEACTNHNLKLNIVIIGGSFNKVENFISQVKDVKEIHSTISHTGFLNVAGVSAALSDCNIGITPVPRHLLGKSGSVAAFLSHGIPVAAPYIKEGYENSAVGFFDQDIVAAITPDADLNHIAVALKNAAVITNRVTPEAVAHNFSLDLSLT